MHVFARFNIIKCCPYRMPNSHYQHQIYASHPSSVTSITKSMFSRIQTSPTTDATHNRHQRRAPGFKNRHNNPNNRHRPETEARGVEFLILSYIWDVLNSWQEGTQYFNITSLYVSAGTSTYNKLECVLGSTTSVPLYTPRKN